MHISAIIIVESTSCEIGNFIVDVIYKTVLAAIDILKTDICSTFCEMSSISSILGIQKYITLSLIIILFLPQKCISEK